MPSTSRVGIGSMPGSIHEPGVATLPEERIDGRPYGSGHTGFEGLFFFLTFVFLKLIFFLSLSPSLSRYSGSWTYVPSNTS